ncbi:WD40-repeat-containing domain protein [Scheffersomyces amazonensis]|uniref:WD40-repeat-containing domain protein n=1 Tax=Scheffersomyces amazonensis TaxID=1078765 RepID=UPI00315D96AC
MHILKLPWFGHRTDNKTIECYSISISQDGTRLASGGLDGNVKIWDVSTIMKFKQLTTEVPPKDKQIDQNEKSINGIDNTNNTTNNDNLPPKSLRRPLCSMSRHNGVVTSVKFSPDGKYLASGSDDKICLIWEKDENQNKQPQFGETEADLEHWTVKKRLVAHDNDIQDICWSPDSSLLVTVGLDRSIIIWNAFTFERIKRYDIHQSMVKGIVFDPANKFFATASDDRTVRIFRYYKKINEYNNYDFQMEHIVMDPFKKSPLTSYFRRMSWSPDGQHIAVPNGTNGPVPSVVIISRGTWATDVSLIGHEAPCEVCSFSPRLFDLGNDDNSLSNKRKKDDNKTFSTILATGGQDRTLAIWSTSNTKPLVVLEDIVEKTITDICWTPQGETLFLSCLDGSITVVSFDSLELGGKVVSEDLVDAQLTRYGADRESNIFPESIEQLKLEDISSEIDRKGSKAFIQPVKLEVKSEKEPIIKSPPTISQINSPPSIDGPPPSIVSLSPKKSTKLVQNITITKNGKKRVAPLLVSTSNASKSSPQKVSSLFSSVKKIQISSKISQSSYFLPRLGVQTSVHGYKSRENSGSVSNVGAQENGLNSNANDLNDNDNEDIGGFDENSTVQNGNANGSISEASLKRQYNRLKRKIMDDKYPNTFKSISNLPPMVFNNNVRELNNELNALYSKIVLQKDQNGGIQSEISSNSQLEYDEDVLFSVIVKSINHIHKSNELLDDDIESQAQDQDQDSIKNIRTIIEVRNGQPWKMELEEELDKTKESDNDFDDPTRLIVSNDLSPTKRLYSLFFPYRIQHVLPMVIDEVLQFIVVASFHGTIQIIKASTGQFVCPSFELGFNVIALRSVNNYLMMLTSKGLIYSWQLNDEQAGIKRILSGISLAAVLNHNIEISLPEHYDHNRPLNIALQSVRYFEVSSKDGTPLIVLNGQTNRTYDIFKYSLDLMTWVKVIDSYYYLAYNDEEIQQLQRMDGSTIDSLIHRTFNDFQNDVKRRKINSYAFEDKQPLTQLKEIMVSRYNELLDLI